MTAVWRSYGHSLPTHLQETDIMSWIVYVMSWIVYAMTGLHPSRQQQVHEDTRQRALALTLCVMPVTVLWALTTFLVSRHVYDLETGTAIAAGALSALVILIIERVVIAGPAGFFLYLKRAVIAVLIAVVGSVGLDIVWFAPDIAVQYLVTLNARDEQQIARLQQQVRDAKSAADGKHQELVLELACKGPSQKCGDGPASRALRQEHQHLTEVWRREAEALAQFRAGVDQSQRARREADPETLLKTSGLGNGLAARVESLHEFLEARPHAKRMAVILFALMLAVELFCVTTKVAWGRTQDDKLKAARDKLLLTRLDNYVKEQHPPLRRPTRLPPPE